MRPSRLPIQVRMDDSDNSSRQNARSTHPNTNNNNNNLNFNFNLNTNTTTNNNLTQPSQQVKILRRPKPVASQVAVNSTINNNISQAPTTNATQVNRHTSDKELDRQPKPAPWKGPLLFSHVVGGASSRPGQSASTISHQFPATTPTTTEQQPERRQKASKATFTNKQPRSYQERADEYAKARLRILGSAFPDDHEEDLTRKYDDNVNRLINSNFNQEEPANNQLAGSNGDGGNFTRRPNE